MTGHSGQDGRLRALQQALDPAAAGTALDWTRFRAAMGAWIAACRQDGSVPRDGAVPGAGWTGQSPMSHPAEDDGHTSPAATQLQGDNTDITTPAEAAGLWSRARQLAAQNTKLQRDAELAEELNARLAEETAQLQAQLRRCSQGAPGDGVLNAWNAETPFGPGSSRQALEQARVAVEELEDVKAVVKRLEEENAELRRQARHANQRLIAEGQGLREQIQAQAARMANLEAQLCRGTALLSARDAALAQAGQRAQELTAGLEEYERVVQELRLETTQMRQQLGRLRDAWAMRPWYPRGQPDIQATAAVSRGTGDTEEEEEDTGTVLSGGRGLAGSSEEVAKAVAPQAPLSSWVPLSRWAPLSPWALALLALLALLYLLPHQWPQPQLRYRSPP
ncbi:KASH5 protein, partial [Myiagra hebetior]|nr:KASH5 protein [Myiagra hebetior]